MIPYPEGHLSEVLMIGYYQSPPEGPTGPYVIPQHCETVELLLGGKTFFAEDDSGELKPYGRGSLFWHKAGEPTVHHTDPDAPYRCVVFHFRVRDDIRPAPRVSAFLDLGALDVFASEAVRSFHDDNCDRQMLAQYCYHTLRFHALRNLQRSRSGMMPMKLYQAIQYMEKHFHEPLTIADLAAHCRLSRPYLFTLFKHSLNRSPYQYLLAIRLNNAKAMLADNQANIKEIASGCGFENIEVFYRVFKKATGMTPGAFRETHHPYGYL